MEPEAFRFRPLKALDVRDVSCFSTERLRTVALCKSHQVERTRNEDAEVTSTFAALVYEQLQPLAFPVLCRVEVVPTLGKKGPNC